MEEYCAYKYEHICDFKKIILNKSFNLHFNMTVKWNVNYCHTNRLLIFSSSFERS